MAKKRTDAETQPANEHEAELIGILKQLDNEGVSLVEADWRSMSESENASAIKWAADRRVGTKTMLPLCLRKFASEPLLVEQEQYRFVQAEARQTILPVQFLKPAISKKAEDGTRRIKMVASVPLTNARGADCDRLFRYTRCKVEFSARDKNQWTSTLPGLEDALAQIVECEADFSGYNASRHATRITWLIEEGEFTKDDAYDLEDQMGSIRIEVLGEAKKGVLDGEESHETVAPLVEQKKPRGRPKKEEAKLPGIEDEPNGVSHSVAMTDRYQVDILIKKLAADKFSCCWDGVGPDGAITEPDPGTRTSPIQAAIASIGKAVDYWTEFDEDSEAQAITARLRHWLSELEKGKTPTQIESELENAE